MPCLQSDAATAMGEEYPITRYPTTVTGDLIEVSSSNSPSSRRSSLLSSIPSTTASDTSYDDEDDSRTVKPGSINLVEELETRLDEGDTKGKGKLPQRISDIAGPSRSRAAPAESSSTTYINEWKYVINEQNSESPKDKESVIHDVESRPHSSDSPTEELSTFIPPTRTTPSEANPSSVVLPGPLIASPSSHSELSYTLEVRPPSSLVQHGDTSQPSHHSQALSEILSVPPPESPQQLPLGQEASVSRFGSRRATVRVASPPAEVIPIPPVPSVRIVRTQAQPTELSRQVPSITTRPSGFTASLPQDTFSWYQASRSTQHLVPEDVSSRPMGENLSSDLHSTMFVDENSSSTYSLSPLVWEETPTNRARTLLTPPPHTSIPRDPHLIDPGVSSSQTTSSADISPNPLLSTPASYRHLHYPGERGDERYPYSQVGRTPVFPMPPPPPAFIPPPDTIPHVPTPSIANMNTPPSAPQRTTRFRVPLPPSPGSSFRASTFNSPFGMRAPSVDSWGTPATVPPQSVHSQPTFDPSPWLEFPQFQPPGRFPVWLPDTDSNGNNMMGWTEADRSHQAWSDPPPQYGSLPPTTPSSEYTPPPGFMVLCRFCGSAPGVCNCRRYPRAPLAATSAGGRTPVRHFAAPHPIFWFSDGTIVFDVEDTHFKIHRYFFERHSDPFRRFLARYSGASTSFVRIPDTKKLDFERLLKVFYPSNLANPDLTTVEEWTSVLTLSVRWRMNELLSLAIQELTPITSAVDKVSLAKRFGLFGYNLAPNSNYNRDWLLPALRELCSRNLPLRLEEARKLDMWTVVKVWEVQHEIYNAGLTHNVAQIERLITRRFGLE